MQRVRTIDVSAIEWRMMEITEDDAAIFTGRFLCFCVEEIVYVIKLNFCGFGACRFWAPHQFKSNMQLKRIGLGFYYIRAPRDKQTLCSAQIGICTQTDENLRSDQQKKTIFAGRMYIPLVYIF